MINALQSDSSNDGASCLQIKAESSCENEKIHNEPLHTYLRKEHDKALSIPIIYAITHTIVNQVQTCNLRMPYFSTWGTSPLGGIDF